MNERIKELAEQAKLTADDVYASIIPLPDWDEYESTWLQDYSNKFAELIIQECASICRDRKLTPSAFTADELLEHFGVE